MFRFLYNGLVRRGTLVPQEMHLRESHAIAKLVERTLGLPEKPKRPISGYLRFYLDNQAKLRESYPELKQKELCQHVSKMWKSLSNEQKFDYSKEFKEKISEYLVQMREYKEKLSEDDKKRMKAMKAKIAKRKASLFTLRNGQRLGKPKKPMNSYMKFFMERFNQRDKRKRTKAENEKFYKDIGIEWLALSDAERAKYDSSAEWEAYYNATYEWEAEMIRTGRSNVIARNPVVPMRVRNQKKIVGD